ncbi:MAG: M20 metallopeptidase family protein [Bacteroidota bacterium]
MAITRQHIIDLTNQYLTEIISIRRHLHQYPELAFHETKTSEYIARQLEETGIPFQKGIAGTGIVGQIKGRDPGAKTIALRADMDALPVQENKNISYCSQHKGIMHACGHDIHMASLLGAAKILHEIQHELNGTVLLIFQPGEEKHPGGAKKMLEEGIFNNIKPDAIIAQHVDPDLPIGVVGFKPGMYMASADELYIKIKGKGGHAGMPDKISDTVYAASQAMMHVHHIINRKSPPQVPNVVSFGKIEADGATNIIPDQVIAHGTFRTMDESWRAEAHERMQKTVRHIAEINDCVGEMEIKKGYPFLINDPDMTSLFHDNAKEYLGKEQVYDLEIKMVAEDFAYFSQKYPSVMYRVGTQKNNHEQHTLHSPNYQIDDKVLITGSGNLAWLAFSFLK